MPTTKQRETPTTIIKDQIFPDQSIDSLEARVQRLAHKKQHLTERLQRSHGIIARLRQQRGELLDMIAENHAARHPFSDDDDNDDDSSVYDDDSDLGELSPCSSSESDTESDTTVEPLGSIRKRRRTTTEETSSRKSRHRLVTVERDASGEYVFPIQLGTITLLDLGHIISSPPSYHNNRYIWPVGFTVQRTYKSMIRPSEMTTYTCTIKESPTGPKFCITAEDQADAPIERDTPTAAWTAVMKEANRDKQRTNFAVSGPEYFGVTHPSIAKMIQELPGASECENYVWRTFDDETPSSSATGASATKLGRTAVTKSGSEDSRQNKK